MIDVTEERLKALTRPAGFHSQKPARLRRIAIWWLQRIGDWDFPLQELPLLLGGSVRNGRSETMLDMGNGKDIRRELLDINGVGSETADAILLYAFGFPFFVVDGYKKRSLVRMGAADAGVGYDELQALFHSLLPVDVPLYNDFHAQFVQLGKEYCRRTPICIGCPLRDLCNLGSGVT